jgi:cellulose synthase/poly-beta-1,6-N-acetylglucosamine synthase-like glycosyltransferase
MNRRRPPRAVSPGSLLLVATGAPIAAATAYLAGLTAVAWWARARGAGRTELSRAPSHGFAVLVPAHDEERLIASTVDSLMALDYPADWFGVHVVADNCTDATAAIARAHGATVHERDDPEHGGKGPALMWALDRLRASGTVSDAVAVVDADTIVHRNFLRVMDAKLAGGADAVQAYYAVRDADASALVGFRAAALAARHYLRPLARTVLGGSSGLYGNGMVFRTEVFDDHRWTSHLTEDIELQLELLLEGRPVAFAPDAVVEAEMPTTVEASRTQHERWERGRLEMVRRYLPRLLRHAAARENRHRFATADAAVDQLIPPFSVLVAATAGWAGSVTLDALVRSPRRPWRVAVAAGLVLAQAGYVLSSLRMVSAPSAVYRSLAAAPRMVIWKVLLWARMLGRRSQVDWVRTGRNEAAPTTAEATG